MKTPTNKEMADAMRTMTRYSMTTFVDCESKSATAVFYCGILATEPCATPDEAPGALCRAINRCAELARAKLAAPSL